MHLRNDAQLSWRLESFGANGLPRSMAVRNTLMLLTKPPTAQVGKLVLFHNAVTKVGRSGDITLLRKGVAGVHVARLEAFLKPVHTLLRTTMSKGLRIHRAPRHAL
jgi:hypothetical protein